MYVPRHTKQVFVEKVDFVSGVGHFPEPKAESGNSFKGGNLEKLITDLGVFGFDAESKRMKILSIHPGVDLEEIEQNTGFKLLVPAKIETTPPPTGEEIELIHELDPLGIRRLETVSVHGRTELLEEIFREEATLRFREKMSRY
jgi:hypothetical protein